jgi:pimeloyl-ACP methyl ester carboxylesterase
MRHLWLHGFASGPTSSKGRFVGERLRERGIELVVPDLNEPAFFDLTVTRMLERVDALAGSDRVVLFGSSLGGFTAATWAARRPGRVEALVLLAPAFDLAPRWARRMGPAEVEKWRRSGRFAFDHYAYGRKEDLSSAFLADAQHYESFPLPDCPTLVIQGTRDEVVDPALAREFTRRMAGRARLVELPEGHELTADLPGLWRQTDAFLQATDRGRPRST